ncbi:MAG TPA: NAD(P)-dependent oxidoreductase [Gammaproteobacteria bacterium]|nr:NAD(P)-dependent oxidoreductase [Gammaproteobacteria bacterium]
MSQVIIVTGGSRGIGAATAILAAEGGYDVCINYKSDSSAADAVVAAITAVGQSGLSVQGDVANGNDVVRLFEVCNEKLGAPSGLVNNAGILPMQSRVAEMTSERLQHVFSVNITGCFLCAREAVKYMSTNSGGTGGSIVNLSSAAARLGSPHEFVDYAASKGAIDAFTIGLAKEVATEGIRVNAVRPGLIDTEIHASAGEPQRIDRLRSAIPMQREGSAEEVAQTILWLLSPSSSYTTGSFIEVSGGR